MRGKQELKKKKIGFKLRILLGHFSLVATHPALLTSYDS